MGNSPVKSSGAFRRKATLIVPLVFTMVCGVLALVNPSAVDEHLETLLVDYRFKVRNLVAPPEAPEDVMVVAIDEPSLARYGRWPWSRRLQAELIEGIFKDGPRAVAVDIFYPEPESPEADSTLAGVFTRHRERLVVALAFEVEEGRAFGGAVQDALYDSAFLHVENASRLEPPEAYRVLLPPEPIAESAQYGHVYTLPDRDGKLRWERLYIGYGEEYFPSLAVQAARIALGVAPEEMSIIGGSGVTLGERYVPADEHGGLFINYLGPEGSFRTISAADVLSGGVPEGTFRDRVVFVGTSAIATYDLRVTPFSANMTGAEKNATVAANVISGDFIRKVPLSVDVLSVVLAGLFAAFLCQRPRALFSIAVFAALVAFVMLVNQVLFLEGFRTVLVYPLLVVVGNCGFVIGYKYFIEEKRAREIRRIFSSYVTERVVDELIDKPHLARLGGERREVTVLFSDIRGFTYFAEAHTPEEVVATLNEYLEAMTEVVFRWEGTLDKFIGDALVAFWGAPMEQGNHAELAVRCALHMINRIGALQEKWRSEGKTPFEIGIGINTGEVVVGNIGSEDKKMDYTVIGDHVNLGARIESLTRKYNAKIMITEFTLEKIRDLITTGCIGHTSVRGKEQVIVKGKEKPVEVFELTSSEPGLESLVTECEKRVVRLNEK
jgi:adenylate cyclase